MKSQFLMLEEAHWNTFEFTVSGRKFPVNVLFLGDEKLVSAEDVSLILGVYKSIFYDRCDSIDLGTGTWLSLPHLEEGLFMFESSDASSLRELLRTILESAPSGDTVRWSFMNE